MSGTKLTGKEAEGPSSRYDALKALSDAATPGPWSYAPRRLMIGGQEGPLMGYLVGDRSTPEGMTVSLGSERVADHEFVAALVNAYRAGLLVPSEQQAFHGVGYIDRQGCVQWEPNIHPSHLNPYQIIYVSHLPKQLRGNGQ